MLIRMNRTLSRRRPGFTLTEVLISLGIFAIGAIAVASLFPVAALLQKETADSILSRQAATNARAMIEGIGITYEEGDNTTDLGMYHSLSNLTNENDVLPIGLPSPVGPDTVLASVTTFDERFTLAERSFPSTELNPVDPTRTLPWPTRYETRDQYWFFFARDSNGDPVTPNWQGYLLIVERKNDQNYAAVEADLTFDVPTEQGTPYITLDGKIGEWNTLVRPSFPGAGVYFHPNAIAVEIFDFTTTTP